MKTIKEILVLFQLNINGRYYFMSRALIVVDVQNDFYPGGALAVPEADQINNRINNLMASGRYKKIIGTQDWHMKTHNSFASTHNKKPFSSYDSNGKNTVLWPD